MDSESGNFVVFVDELADQRVGLDDGRIDGTVDARAPLSRKMETELRRTALSGLASDLMAPAGASMARSAGSAAGAMSAEMTAGVTADDGPAFGGADLEGKILEGIGAIILDGDQTDIASLEGVIGLSVFPDVQVPLADPEDAEEEADIDFWHLAQVGADEDPQAGEGILVGVLDTGIDRDHPEFAGKTVHFAEFD